SSNIDLIDTLPPALYEAVLENKTEDTANRDLATGNWVMRCEAGTLDDIRALGVNGLAEQRGFATAGRVSCINLALYRTAEQQFVRALVTSPWAQWMQQVQPLRLQYELFSNANPMMAPVAGMAEEVRKNRQPSSADNPFIALQEIASDQIVATLDAWREFSEAFAERTFLNVYGSPMLQAAGGIDTFGTRALQRAGRDPLHQERC